MSVLDLVVVVEGFLERNLRRQGGSCHCGYRSCGKNGDECECEWSTCCSSCREREGDSTRTEEMKVGQRKGFGGIWWSYWSAAPELG